MAVVVLEEPFSLKLFGWPATLLLLLLLLLLLKTAAADVKRNRPCFK